MMNSQLVLYSKGCSNETHVGIILDRLKAIKDISSGHWDMPPTDILVILSSH